MFVISSWQADRLWPSLIFFSLIHLTPAAPWMVWDAFCWQQVPTVCYPELNPKDLCAWGLGAGLVLEAWIFWAFAVLAYSSSFWICPWTSVVFPGIAVKCFLEQALYFGLMALSVKGRKTYQFKVQPQLLAKPPFLRKWLGFFTCQILFPTGT